MLRLIQTVDGTRYVLSQFGHFVPEGGTGRDAPANFWDRPTAERMLTSLVGCPGPVVIEESAEFRAAFPAQSPTKPLMSDLAKRKRGK